MRGGLWGELGCGGRAWVRGEMGDGMVVWVFALLAWACWKGSSVMEGCMFERRVVVQGSGCVRSYETSMHVRKVQQLHIYQLLIPLSTTTTFYYSPGQASLVETILIPDIVLVFNCSVGALKSGVLGREARRRGRSALRSMYGYGRGSGRGQFVSER